MINMMRKSFLLVGAALFSASLAAATDYSTWEGFLGYNFVRFNPNSDFVPSFNANGGNAQAVYNFSRYFGAVFDVGASTRGTLNQTPVNITNVSYTLGPRFTYQKHSRLHPYVQVLFGGAHTSVTTPITVTSPGETTTLPASVVPPIIPGSAFQAQLSASSNNFAMLAGGGLDIKLSKHIAIRPFEADYYLTRVPSFLTGNTSNRNNFRYSAGINFLLGAR
jgi:opacity protein-like surface antigen